MRLCFLILLTACGATPAKTLPLIAPLVKAALPSGLSPSAARDDTVPVLDQFRQRFFSGSGPTDVLSVLASLDQRVTEINTQLANGPHCATQAPVTYTLHALTDNAAFTAQCAVTDAGGFSEFADDSGTVHLFSATGTTRIAAVVTPQADGSASVEAWIALGLTNAPAWDSGSYGVMHLQANSTSHAFEMSVAGVGVGFCGAHLQSDGAVVSMIGSGDMGSTCTAQESACVTTADLTVAGDCSGLAAAALASLGREAAAASETTQHGPVGTTSFGASRYPEGGNLVIDGTSGDALHFAPTGVAAGVGAL